MSIAYTYEIVLVDQAARCMEVVYTSEGNPKMHVSARLPYEGESVEAVVEAYAPVRYWEELKVPVATVEVGRSGEVIPRPEDAAQIAATSRDMLLVQSDWTQLPDAPLTAEQKSQWVAYRQQLRDVTKQSGFPNNINWPTPPGFSVSIL